MSAARGAGRRPGARTAPARIPAVAAALCLCAGACDDVNVGAPKPPGPVCNQYRDYIHTVAIGRPAGRVFDAAVSGRIAFTAGDAGVSIVDLEDAADTRVVAVLPALAGARAVDAAGEWLFVAAGDDGLAVVNVSNPAAPVVAPSVAIPGTTVDVRVTGSRVYAANEDLGLVVIDATDPAAAVVTGIENTPGRAVAVAASGMLAFVADEQLGLRIVDVSDPAAPFLIRALAVPGFMEGVDARDHLVAVAAGGAGMQLVDATLPGFASVVGSFDTPSNAVGVALAGDVAYVADAVSGIVLADVRNPGAPVSRGVIGTPVATVAVAVSGEHLAVADDAAGVRLVDVVPGIAAPFATLAPGGDARTMAGMGDLVVVGDAAFGLRVVDPAARAVVGELPFTGAARDVFVADSVAYVARQGGNVLIADLRVPSAPVQAGTIPQTGSAEAVGVDGPFAYVLDAGNIVFERRIDGTGTPRSYDAGDVYFPSLTLDRDVQYGTLVYLPDRRGSVTIMLASLMRPLAVFPVGGSAERVVLHRVDGPLGPGTGRHAYVAVSGLLNGQSAIEVYDLTGDPRFPVLLARVPCGGGVVDVALSPVRMIAGGGAGGCEIFDGVPGAAVRPDGLLIAPAWRVAVSGATLVVAGGARGILLAELEGCLN